MNLLELASLQGLSPKKKGSTRGGEYCSPCPSCGGKDRFILHPHACDGKGAYFCRQCGIKGDGIQFGRDFLGYTFRQALGAMEKASSFSFDCSNCSSVAIPSQSKQKMDLQRWEKKASEFIQSACQRLAMSQEGLRELQRRGFKDNTIVYWKLGFNPVERFDHRDQWGLEDELNANGRQKKVWLPKGITIPYSYNNSVKKIRIRQLGINAEERKYVVISGSSSCLSWYGGSLSLPVVLVESDFDAILLWQEAGDLCIPVALGSCSAKPNEEDYNLLRQASTILYALDWDSAGRKAFEYWKLFPNIKPWPSANGKSPGDDFLAGVNLKDWVIHGLTDT